MNYNKIWCQGDIWLPPLQTFPSLFLKNILCIRQTQETWSQSPPELMFGNFLLQSTVTKGWQCPARRDGTPERHTPRRLWPSAWPICPECVLRFWVVAKIMNTSLVPVVSVSCFCFSAWNEVSRSFSLIFCLIGTFCVVILSGFWMCFCCCC